MGENSNKRSRENDVLGENDVVFDLGEGMQEVMNKRKARKLKLHSPEERLTYIFRRKLEFCCRDEKLEEALELYQEIKERKISTLPYMYKMILNLLSTVKSKSETHDETSYNQSLKKILAASMEVLNDLRHLPTKKTCLDEACFSGLIKVCSIANDLNKGLELISEMESLNIIPRLRTFSFILAAFCNSGNLDTALNLYEKMLSYSLTLTESEFAVLLDVCRRRQNVEKFYLILDSFMINIYKPNRSTWEILKKWFSSEIAQGSKSPFKCVTEVMDKNGKSSLSGRVLKSVELSARQEEKLVDQVEKLVCTNDKRTKQWKFFKEWLQENHGFDIIIDAANVGFYKQNFSGGAFSYSQIDAIVNYYEKLGKKVLVLLHYFRTTPRLVSDQDAPLVEKWKERGIIFCCQTGNNDDWYWLFACIFYGGRSLVVTNDEMRDHHFQMLQHSSFLQWKERHQVHFDLKGRDHMEVVVTEPSIYSKRSQKLADSYHFPDAMSDEWLSCYRE